jgi:hypothetical protein
MIADGLHWAFDHQSSSFNQVAETASSPSGKARVCKTLIMGSNPIDAS